MKGLTLRQEEMLRYLQEHFTQNGYWPSIRDIQNHFDFKSTNAVMGHLRALEKKGSLQRIPGHARAYRINESLSDPQGSPNITPFNDNTIEVTDIPVYGNIAAGYPDRVESGAAISQLQVDVHTAGLQRSNHQVFALKVEGESMIDAGIMDGDIVIVEQKEARNGDIVAALIDNETTLKRFIQEPGRPPYLKSENKRYPSFHPVMELMIQGVAKSVVRSL